jgi:putative hydrolase of the HAD superfamily
MPITTVFFDLDDTLYPASSGLWQAIRERISLYMHEVIGIPWEEVPDLRRRYFEEYGTALRGLEANYPIQRNEYLTFVHDLPLQDYIQPDTNLITALEKLQARKLIFTNADSAHARRVMTVLDVGHLFDGIVDINDMEPYCKPMPGSFQLALDRAEEMYPGSCALIDDMPRNTTGAHDFGIRTVLFGTDQLHPGADATLTNWLDLPLVLEKLETINNHAAS